MPFWRSGSPGGGDSIAFTISGGRKGDPLRGAALIATTPNDGQEYDRVQSGTYQYRLCNAGTTLCSNTVSVTVP